MTMMGDACICVDAICVNDENEEFSDWYERKVTSDEEQKCTECDRTIPIGAPHVRHFGLRDEEDWNEDDEIIITREELHCECLCCAAVRASLFDCGWWVGQVWQLIRDHMDEVMPIDDDDDGDESWLDPPTKPIGPSGW